MRTTAELHSSIAAICPIRGVSVGDWNDRRTWRVDFDPAATAAQRAAAQSVMDTFDPVGQSRDELIASDADYADLLNRLRADQRNRSRQRQIVVGQNPAGAL
jgi:hypothetical protein